MGVGGWGGRSLEEGVELDLRRTGAIALNVQPSTGQSRSSQATQSPPPHSTRERRNSARRCSRESEATINRGSRDATAATAARVARSHRDARPHDRGRADAAVAALLSGSSCAAAAGTAPRALPIPIFVRTSARICDDDVGQQMGCIVWRHTRCNACGATRAVGTPPALERRVSGR